MFIPKAFRDALERAQKSADIMPSSQLSYMLESELGKDWKDKFEEFDMSPIAAASIGQVHKARNKDGMDLAVKIQYPGVANSIDSDLNNMKRLFVYTKIFPKQFFIEDVINNARKELKEECEYKIEAAKHLKFRAMLGEQRHFYVPKIDQKLSTNRVLATEFVYGVRNMSTTISNKSSVEYRAGKRYEPRDPRPHWRANFPYYAKAVVWYEVHAD